MIITLLRWTFQKFLMTSDSSMERIYQELFTLTDFHSDLIYKLIHTFKQILSERKLVSKKYNASLALW